MSVIILLLFVSISVAGLFLFAFIWCVKNGQFIDEVSPSMRILFDDQPHIVKETNSIHEPELNQSTIKSILR